MGVLGDTQRGTVQPDFHHIAFITHGAEKTVKQTVQLKTDTASAAHHNFLVNYIHIVAQRSSGTATLQIFEGDGFYMEAKDFLQILTGWLCRAGIADTVKISLNIHKVTSQTNIEQNFWTM